jgi:hypothetical protein
MSLRRREFIAALGARQRGRSRRAQQRDRVRRIGFSPARNA